MYELGLLYKIKYKIQEVCHYLQKSDNKITVSLFNLFFASVITRIIHITFLLF